MTAPTSPHRAFEIEIHVGGDTWTDAVDELSRFVRNVIDNGEKANLVSGGVTSGGWLMVLVDPEMTHEKYVRAIRAWLAATRAEKMP